MPTVSHLHPSYSDETWTRLTERLPDISKAMTSDQLLQGGRNQVYKIDLAGKPTVLKIFSNKGAWKKIAYRFSTSKARRSFEHSELITNAGLNSPQPIAWREEWDGKWLSTNYYLCEYVAYDHDVSALRDPQTEDWQTKAKLAGSIIAQMHDAGLEHLDLNSGNLLFKKDDNGDWQGFIIDNNRMRIGKVSLKRGIKCLFLMGLESDALDLLIEAYAEKRGADLEDCRKRYFNTLKRHNFKWRLKNKTRPWRRKLVL